MYMMKTNHRKHRPVAQCLVVTRRTGFGVVALISAISFFVWLQHTWPEVHRGKTAFQHFNRREKGEKLKIEYTTLLHQNNNSAVLESTVVKGTIPSEIQYNDYIFFDWSSEADDFGYLNYKSLESLLYILPHAKFIVHIIGPAATNYYKFTGLLSKHTFQKYIKYGFNLRVDVVDDIVLYHSRDTIKTGVPLEKAKDDNILSLLYPGYIYSKSAMMSCCQHKRAKDITGGMKVPYHLLFFNRIVSLNQYGGVYSDFSWVYFQELTQKDNFLRHNFSEPIQGVILKALCDLPTQFRSMNTILRLQRSCIFSSLLVFSKSNPVLQCMLSLYGDDDDGGEESSNSNSSSRSRTIERRRVILPKDGQYPEESFLSCIARDERYEGARCIQRAFDFCFASKDSVNYFARPSDSNVWTLSSLGDNNEGQGTNMVYSSSIVSPPANCVDLPHDAHSAVQYSDALLLRQTSQVSLCLQSRGVLWMGANGNRFTWHRPEKGSILSLLLKQVIQKDGKKLPTQLYDSASTLTQRQLDIQTCFREAQRSATPCSHYSTVPPLKVKNFHKIYSNNTLFQADLSCAPKFVIAGFMKAGSSYLYDALMRHPQMVRTLQGAAFKETGCYLPEVAYEKNRMQCFPFVEENDSILFGDATVYYAGRRQVPEYLRKDNPNLKVLFIVRNPIGRMESHYRYGYQLHANSQQSPQLSINDMIDMALDERKGGLMEVFHLANYSSEGNSNATLTSSLLEAMVARYLKGFRSKDFKHYQRAASIVSHSLYYPAIYHWIKVFGPSNIKVVAMEWFSPESLPLQYKLSKIQSLGLLESDFFDRWDKKNRKKKVDQYFLKVIYSDIYRFLGLCESWSEIPTSVDKHQTGLKVDTNSIIHSDVTISASNKVRMQKFFLPFNNYLSELLGDISDVFLIFIFFVKKKLAIMDAISEYFSLHYHAHDSVIKYTKKIESENASNSPVSSQYDYAMCFKADVERTGGAPNGNQVEICKSIVHELETLGLFSTFIYSSVRSDKVIVLLKPNMEKIKKFADLIQFKIEMNPEYLRSRIKNGLRFVEEGKHGDCKIAPRNINENVTVMKPFDHIFGRFEYEDELQDMYLKSETSGSPIAVHNRLMLIYLLLIAPRRLGGCDVPLSSLLYHKQILSFFPLHDRKITDQLEEHVFQLWQPLWQAPFYDFKEYFGEKIGLFNVFIAYYTRWLVFPSIVGLIFQFIVWATNVKTFSSPVLPFYSVLVSVWGLLMLKYWKRKEAIIAVWWGTSSFEEKEQQRPEFTGELIESFIDGTKIIYVRSSDYAFSIVSSVIVVSTFIVIMCATLGSIYFFRYSLNSSSASYIASVLNMALSLVMNIVYQYVAKKLTDNENHRTDTIYEDALSVKLFVFQFLNSYASFFFIAFVAAYIPSPSNNPHNYPGQCGAETCMQPLAINLGIIYGMRLTLSNFLDIFIPYITCRMKRKKDLGDASADTKLSSPEEESLLMPYDPITENINDYADAAVQYGFTMMFITALPCATFFSFLSNFFRVKATLWMRINLYQRPVPTSAEDMGSWYSIFQILNAIAIITNAGLICITMDVLDGFSTAAHFWIFIGYQWALFSFFFAMNYFVSDIPEEAVIQKKRQQFITSIVIEKVPDENEDLVGKIPPGQNKIRSLVVEDAASRTCCSSEKRSRVREEFLTVSGLPKLNMKVYPVEQPVVTEKPVPYQLISTQPRPQPQILLQSQQRQQVYPQQQMQPQLLVPQQQRQQVSPQIYRPNENAQPQPYYTVGTAPPPNGVILVSQQLPIQYTTNPNRGYPLAQPGQQPGPAYPQQYVTANFQHPTQSTQSGYVWN